MNAPQLRIGSAVCHLVAEGEGRLRRPQKELVADAVAQLVLRVARREIGRRCRATDRVRCATTSRPSSVSSCARIEPVQPSPMMTTSFVAACAPCLASGLVGVHSAAPDDADGRMGIALVVTADPVAVIVTGAREADHLPRAHVAIAAVDRIGEKSLLHVLEQALEERLAVDAVELERAALEALNDGVLVGAASSAKALPACSRRAMRSSAASASRYCCAGPSAFAAPAAWSLDERRLT